MNIERREIAIMTLCAEQWLRIAHIANYLHIPHSTIESTMKGLTDSGMMRKDRRIENLDGRGKVVAVYYRTKSV